MASPLPVGGLNNSSISSARTVDILWAARDLYRATSETRSRFELPFRTNNRYYGLILTQILITDEPLINENWVIHIGFRRWIEYALMEHLDPPLATSNTPHSHTPIPSPIANCWMPLNWIPTSSMLLSCCKFCIYTHPVNSKFTIWHYLYVHVHVYTCNILKSSWLQAMSFNSCICLYPRKIFIRVLNLFIAFV